MKTISILNLKGGIGKTFTAANMAYEMGKLGYNVLLIDNDKQGNLSRAYGTYNPELTAPAAKLLRGEWKRLDELIQTTDYRGIDMIPSNLSLFGAAWEMTKSDEAIQTGRYSRLMEELQRIEKTVGAEPGSYDYCLIDNPPDIGLNVLNALEASDEVIVPVKIDEDALEGLDIVAGQIEDAKELNPRLALAGVLITAYQKTDGEAAGLEWLRQQTKYKILGVIRYSKKVAESSFLHTPIYAYSPRSAAAQDYKHFTSEYLRKGM